MESSEQDLQDQPQKRRVALMGEFSAGKSTLSNLLLGADPMPTRVTATRLPPVWVSYGAPGATLVGHDGSEEDVDPAELDQVDLERTRMIRLSMESDALQLCDLIDMPGISDPNMSSEVWQSVIGEADHVIWCTHATQAWRQSEAATWESIREMTSGCNILLVTQIDKLTSQRDRARVLARLKKETGDQFSGIYPVALLDAIRAGEDEARWDASGAGPFIEALIEMLLRTGLQEDGVAVEEPEAEVAISEPVAAPVEEVAAVSDEPRVMPKRVQARSGTARPERRARGDAGDLQQLERF